MRPIEGLERRGGGDRLVNSPVDAPETYLAAIAVDLDPVMLAIGRSAFGTVDARLRRATAPGDMKPDPRV